MCTVSCSSRSCFFLFFFFFTLRIIQWLQNRNIYFLPFLRSPLHWTISGRESAILSKRVMALEQNKLEIIRHNILINRQFEPSSSSSNLQVFVRNRMSCLECTELNSTLDDRSSTDRPPIELAWSVKPARKPVWLPYHLMVNAPAAAETAQRVPHRHSGQRLKLIQADRTQFQSPPASPQPLSLADRWHHHQQHHDASRLGGRADATSTGRWLISNYSSILQASCRPSTHHTHTRTFMQWFMRYKSLQIESDWFMFASDGMKPL